MKYNGHKNRNYWNVSLWINNDEGPYRTAYELVRKLGRRKAAKAMLEGFAEAGVKATPDGEPYSVGSIYAAMEGME